MTDEHSERLEKAIETGQWNVSTLHDHITEILLQMERRLDDRFTAQETATAAALAAAKEAVNAAMAAAEKAVLKAEALATSRAEQQNEWRQTVTDLTQTMMPRAEYEQVHGTLVTQMSDLVTRVNIKEGKGLGSSATMVWMFVGLAGAMSVITLVIDLLIKH
jgi:mevalonate kinase